MYRICSLVPVFGAASRPERSETAPSAVERQSGNVPLPPGSGGRAHPLLPAREDVATEPKRDLLEFFFLANRA